jgi:hypothetical protein
VGRRKKEIDPEKVRKLATAGLTVEEIAALLDCGKRTLETRFCAAIKEGRLRKNACLKRKQFQVAMHGSVPMLIWLGKNDLGQADTPPPQSQSGPITVVINGAESDDDPGESQAAGADPRAES